MQEIHYCLATENHGLKRTVMKLLIHQWADVMGQNYVS